MKLNADVKIDIFREKKPRIWKNKKHYHLQVQANSKKNCTKKQMLFLVSMGKTGLSHDIFFEFSVGPFEVVEVE